MYRKLALAIVCAAAMAPLASCGGPKVCKEQNPGSFNTFLKDEWRTYCEEYRQHVESPASYSLVDLTTFLANHPKRVKELEKTLYRFDKFESCFESPREELELRNLQSCLQDNDQSDLEITNAWTSQAEPWVEDLQLRVQAITPRIGDAEREAQRQRKKVAEAFDFQSKLEGRAFESLQVELLSLDKAIGEVEGVDRDFKAIVAQGQGHEALARAMQEQVANVNAIIADIAALRARHDALASEARFLELASLSAGVACPPTLKGASKELKIAQKVAGGRNNEVGGSGVRILTNVRADASGDTDFERFEGFVCGVRGPENQFDGATQLCAQYRFVIERQRPNGTNSWTDWTLKSFEEAGPSGGVDCALRKK